MSLWSLLRARRLVASRAGWGRAQVLAHQRASLSDLLADVWQRSPFYRDWFSSHGIRQGDLGDLTVRDLPILDKETLMAGFDRVAEDPLLRRERLEAWIHSDAPLGLYAGRYAVVHTSGTSGTMGIFVYDRDAWSRCRGVAAARGRGRFRLNPLCRDRLAFCGATHGRFAGVTSMVTLPRVLFARLLCSVLDPVPETIARLERFRPEKLYGYPSAVHELARRALAGELRIHPDTVTCGGEVLTKEARTAIRNAWGVGATDVYAASESMCIAYGDPDGAGLSLVEDENVVEILDAADDPVAPGATGRVVLTSLYNRTIPIIRYDMRDYVTRGHRRDDAPYERILGVRGRVNDALPVLEADGTAGSIHPVVLSEFFVVGIRRFQFVSEALDRVTVRYVAATDLHREVQDEFRRILALKRAHPSIRVTAVRAADLPADAGTGKYRLVVFEASG